MFRITLLAALPYEYRPLLGRTGRWRGAHLGRFKAYRRLTPGVEALLVETGMGRGGIEEAVRMVVERRSADLIVSFGFAGSLCPEFRVGNVISANRLILLEGSEPEAAPAESYLIGSSPVLDDFLDAFHVRKAQLVTVEKPPHKTTLSSSFPHSPTIIDMESGVVARAALRGGAPLVCLRAVSDALEDELDYRLDDISDAQGRICIPKVSRAVLKRPRLLRSFYASWKRSSEAAGQLARILTPFMNLPGSTLVDIAQKCRILPGKRQ